MKQKTTTKMCALTCDCDEYEDDCLRGGLLCKLQEEYEYLEKYPLAVELHVALPFVCDSQNVFLFVFCLRHQNV